MHKSREVLENTFLYISVINWAQLSLKVCLNNSLDNWNLQLCYSSVINLKFTTFVSSVQVDQQAYEFWNF